MIYEKRVNIFLVVNWQNGNYKTCKRLPRGLKGTELSIPINLNFSIPEKPNICINQNIEIPAVKVAESMIDQL
jgi:hypothetical protein